MNNIFFFILCIIIGKPYTKPGIQYKHKTIMNSNTTECPKLQPLILWTVHSEPPDDPSLSCYIQSNNTWFCTDNYILHSLVDNNDSY